MPTNMTMGLPGNRKAPFDPKLGTVDVGGFEEAPTRPPARGLRFLKPAGAIISVAAVCVTFWNSYEWFAGLRPILVALPMAATISGASVLLPDFGIVLMRGGRRIMGALVLVSGILATLFCMVTTVAALYNSRTWGMEAGSVVAANEERARLALADLVADRDRVKEEIARQNALIESTQRKIDTLSADATLKGDSQVLQNRLLTYVTEKKRYETQLSALGTAVENARGKSSSAPTRLDFYGFLAGITRGDAATMEFLTAAIPAVFLEVVAPVMVAIILFL